MGEEGGEARHLVRRASIDSSCQPHGKQRSHGLPLPFFRSTVQGRAPSLRWKKFGWGPGMENYKEEVECVCVFVCACVCVCVRVCVLMNSEHEMG
jgi:hypothetical protein